VIKGHVDESTPDADYKVDGLSGATLTSNGVSNLIKYWMGDTGFKPFLTNLKNGEA
jgi:Na+-transporting NADH:ubiquinone oxidoreductase subunit C